MPLAGLIANGEHVIRLNAERAERAGKVLIAQRLASSHSRLSNPRTVIVLPHAVQRRRADGIRSAR